MDGARREREEVREYARVCSCHRLEREREREQNSALSLSVFSAQSRARVCGHRGRAHGQREVERPEAGSCTRPRRVAGPRTRESFSRIAEERTRSGEIAHALSRRRWEPRQSVAIASGVEWAGSRWHLSPGAAFFFPRSGQRRARRKPEKKHARGKKASPRLPGRRGPACTPSVHFRLTCRTADQSQEEEEGGLHGWNWSELESSVQKKRCE